MSWCVKPLMYGYLWITELADDEVQQLECALEKLAEAEGFCLTEIRYEHQPGCHGMFYRLLAELKQASVRQLVVPSLDHLASHPLLREQLVMRLDEAHVRLWVVEP
jgi:DNA invertase Pin-like site-specific DNA recombinase